MTVSREDRIPWVIMYDWTPIIPEIIISAENKYKMVDNILYALNENFSISIIESPWEEIVSMNIMPDWDRVSCPKPKWYFVYKFTKVKK